MLSPLTNALDRRFLVDAVLPSTLFVLLTAFVTLCGADPARAAARWTAAGAFDWAVLVVAVGVLAVLVSAATPLLLRLFEGYWRTPPGRLLAGWGRRHHQRRLTRLAEDADGYRVIHLRYPLPTQAGEVMPTRFGNVLRCAELYPKDRYGIDTAVTWPRLYQVLPDRQVAQIATARSSVDFLVTLTTYAVVFTGVAAISLLTTGANRWVFLGWVWGAAAVAWLAYLGALAAATSYGQLIRTAFDVHRGDLLAQLDLDESPGVWRRLAQHWYRNVPMGVELEPGPVEASAEEHGVGIPLGWVAWSVVLLGGVMGAVGLG